MTNAPCANWLSECKLQGVQHANRRLCRAHRHLFRQVSSVTTLGRLFIGSATDWERGAQSCSTLGGDGRRVRVGRSIGQSAAIARTAGSNWSGRDAIDPVQFRFQTRSSAGAHPAPAHVQTQTSKV